MEPEGGLFDRRRFLVGSLSAAALSSLPTSFLGEGLARSVQVYVTSEKHRHEAVSSVPFARSTAHSEGADLLSVQPAERYQPVLGFGAALTDAACFLLGGMEPTMRQKFLAETYSPQRMALNMGRVAIGSSDYSRSVYSYDDVDGDTELKHFNIAHDEAYILPMLREIHSFNPDLFLLATPWSPPGWMKTYGSMLGGWMSEEFLEPYSRYLVRFVEDYAKAGVKVDAITSQNELETDQGGSMPATYWTPEIEEKFVRDYLGPQIRKQKIGTQIWLLDHNYNLWKRVRWQLRDQKLREYVAGVAWHGYVGTPDMMSRLHDVDPSIPFYWTEGGPDVTDPLYAVEWTRWGGVFTEAMRNWCRGLITWNLMLDQSGNPNIGPFKCGGLVTLKPDGSILESGQYWTLRHFSEHVQRMAIRIGSHSDASELMHIAFENPDGTSVAVLTNTGAARTVELSYKGATAEIDILADSVSTLFW